LAGAVAGVDEVVFAGVAAGTTAALLAYTGVAPVSSAAINGAR
jgi:hypothetical protein